MSALYRGKMDHNINFIMDDQMKEYLSDLVIQSGLSVSDLIRQCLLIAGPLVLVSPSYALKISLSDIDISKINVTRP